MGWFSGLLCVGSVIGAVTWGSLLHTHNIFYEAHAPGIRSQQFYALNTSVCQWFAVFYFCYGLQFMCFTCTKLLLLQRLTSDATGHSRSHSAGHTQGCIRALPMLFRAMTVAVIVCNAAIMIAYDIAGAYELRVADLHRRAAAACDDQGNDTFSSLALNQQAIAVVTQIGHAEAVQSVSEAAVLLIISIAYLVLVPFSIIMFRAAERLAARMLLSATDRSDNRDKALMEVRRDVIVADTMHAAAEQRQRLVAACCVVLVTYPIRAAYDFLQAYAAVNMSLDPACCQCCSCQSQQYLVSRWLMYTPQFQPIVVALSSPLPLAVSMWLVTAAHTRAQAIAIEVTRAGLGGVH